MPPGRLAYLASRYPVVSHTFVDNELLALEAAGWELLISSLNPLKDEFIHPRLSGLTAPVLYSPPGRVLQSWVEGAKRDQLWPEALIIEHQERFGQDCKAQIRARNALWLAKAFEKHGVKHVHLHFANAATHTAIFLKELTGIGFSFTPQARDFLIETPAELLNEFCAQARFVVAPCQYAAEAILKRAPSAEGKLVQIYNGIDERLYPQATHQLEGKKRVLSVGRMVAMKGFAQLIRAFAQVAEGNAQYELRIIGDGQLRPELEALVRELALEKQVVFLGMQPLEVMREEMRQASVFALAAQYDAQGGSDMLPTVITEAMFCSLPVVATRLAGITEQVQDKKTGRLVKPGELDAFAEALSDVLNNPQKAQQWGRAGKEYAQEVFSQKVSLPRLAKAFTQAMEQGKQSAKEQTENKTSAVKNSSEIEQELCFYDLSLPMRAQWLLAEADVWLQRGAKILVAGVPQAPLLKQLAPIFQHLEWIPDGMVLEAHWQNKADLRAQVAKLRQKFGQQLEGEVLFAAARRVAWMLERVKRKKLFALKLFAMGSEESFLLRLLSEFSSVDFALSSCLHEKEAYREQVLRWIGGGSFQVDFGRESELEFVNNGQQVQPTVNTLLHGKPEPVYRNLGLIKWRAPEREISLLERREALAQWLKLIGGES